ncbi:hypothetical protein BT69DRAFT_1348127 [Atractiella rhizophila]|nr:hypothetical protein BT69DRAFT_1348127 [Atractiella rhizophila]
MSLSRFLPCTDYPVRASYREKRLAPLLLVGAVVAYVALTIWNVFTQGYNDIYTSILLPTFSPDDGNTQCNPAQVVVGSSLYAEPEKNFLWTINSVRENASSAVYAGFEYSGSIFFLFLSSSLLTINRVVIADTLDCAITSLGITYNYMQQDLVYGVCAECYVSASPILNRSNSTMARALAKQTSTKKTETKTMLSLQLCSNFDNVVTNLATWSQQTQRSLQNAIYGLGTLLQDFNFPNGTFNETRWPPYGGPGLTATNLTVEPSSVVLASMWTSGIRFLPTNLTDDGFRGNMEFGPDHAVYVLDMDETVDFLAAYDHTADAGALSGCVLKVAGIGGLNINGPATAALLPKEPTSISQLRNTSIGIASSIMDTAIGDLHGKSFANLYLCTIKTREWKRWLTLIALVLGNNAALFGTFLFVTRYLAEKYDVRKYGPPTVEMDPTTFATTPRITSKEHAPSALSPLISEMSWAEVRNAKMSI